MNDREKTTSKFSDHSDHKEGRQLNEIISSPEGMSANTARIVIDRKLRKEIMGSYDLIGIENKGRYYAAKVDSKDGKWRMELLIDKQTGNIQVVNRKHLRQQP